jgi:hypothetical protein
MEQYRCASSTATYPLRLRSRRTSCEPPDEWLSLPSSAATSSPRDRIRRERERGAVFTTAICFDSNDGEVT